MANENETVEQVCEEMTSCHSPEVYCEDVRNYGYRVSAAHKREIAAKDEEIIKRDSLISELADKLEEFDEGDYGFNRALVAKAREVVK